ncbi:DUF6702 family protein [Thalassotalea profundi]|uniref:Uncharacterized protein n=1 Tax=Thalassotalea profundi TaxID=2036687 RepID=A0ABQ3IWZ0_9GAMM|nr:DUF6702 family protein [Thalassotalea profundi]GHE93969.1 hypothetical protein GCM10011501_24260 [Thalassotalea profundi]
MANKFFFKLFLFIAMGWSIQCFAHKYFFGLTELSVNPRTHTLEVIHQFTAHDIENSIAELTQERFSPEHEKYEEYIQQYFNKRFTISKLGDEIKLNWIGLEIVNGNMYIYQEAPFKNFLSGIVVKNELLVDTYTKQVNTVNYQDNKVQGSLTFTNSQKIANIDNTN